MPKQKLYMEYPLAVRNMDLLWDMVGTPHGMKRWLADDVEEQEDGILNLTWGDPWTNHNIMQARILERERNHRLRLQWTDEDDPDTYWELSIKRSEQTDELCLCIVDYASTEDVNDLREMWDDCLQRLHQHSGF